jgi:hypothetical protein
MNKLVIILVLASAICTADRKTYYVSSSDGDDSNTGLSASVPWKSIAKINYNAGERSTFFHPGDSILFKRGDTFYDGANWSFKGTEDSIIVVGTYGTGSRPIFDANYVKGNWFVPIPGHPGYYSFTLGRGWGGAQFVTL